MNNSGERLKSKASWGRNILVGLGLLLVAGLLFGPGLALKAALAYAGRWAEGQGLELRYEKAGAGFLFTSVTLRGLSVHHVESASTATADAVRLENPSVTGLIRFIREQKIANLEKTLPLAGGLYVEGLNADLPGLPGRLSLTRLNVTAPALPPANTWALPVLFDELELAGLYCEADDGGLELGRLEAERSGDQLAGLQLENVVTWWDSDPPGVARRNKAPTVEVGLVAAGGVDLTLLGRMLDRGEPLDFLTFCDTLEVLRVAVIKEGLDLMGLRQAVFDVHENGGLQSFSRNLELYANLATIMEYEQVIAREPVIAALAAASGGVLDISLNLNLDYQEEGGRVALRDSSLESPGLGRLELGGKLSGVTAVKPGFTPYQLLFTSGDWNVEGFSLLYRDAGLLPALYPALDSIMFKASARGQTPANLMKYYVEPLAAQVEAENGLANLPALLSETRAFLDQPEQLRLRCAPLAPLTVLSLAKLDKYDIIDKLNLSVQVNQRAPVTIMASKGVDHEHLPSVPRPLENSFSEENLEF